MSYEQSIAGLEKELRIKVTGNMVRNPFFGYNPANTFPLNWGNVLGAEPSTVNGTPGTYSHELVIPTGGIVDSDWIVINSGQDSLPLPEFTFSIYSRTTGTPPITLLTEIIGGNNAVVATINCTPGNVLTLESHSVTLPAGVSKIKIRFTAPAGTTAVRFVSLVPGGSEPAYFAPHGITDTEALELINNVLTSFSPTGHSHVITDITGLEAALAVITAGVSNAVGLINTHHHDTRYHLKTGDTVHDGGFQVTQAPVDSLDVVRLTELEAAIGSNIVLGPGSTSDRGYAYLGPALSMAWARGASTWFSGYTNPIVSMIMPLTFSTVYSYALSTENSEAESLITDNDAWFQMVTKPTSGNTFRAVAQCGGNPAIAGYITPFLWILGTPAAHNITITTNGWTGQAAYGQVAPKLQTFQLASTGGLGTIVWEVLSYTGVTLAELIGDDLVRITIPSNEPEDPDYQTSVSGTVTVRATDSTETTVSKVLNITFSPYAQVALVITQNDVNRITDYYPYTPSVYIANQFTGGTTPITWACVAPDSGTPLPGAAISGGNLVASAVNGPGTWTVKLQATDSDPTTPQVVTKQITYSVTTYVPSEGGYCFEEDTYVLMADGVGKMFKDLKAGDYVMSVPEMSHERNARVIQPCMVTDLMKVPGRGDEANCSIINGVKATPGHAFATVEENGSGAWTRAMEIKEDTLIVMIQDQLPVAIPAGDVTLGDSPVQVAMNLGNILHTYFVGASENGPWMLVHNTTYTSY
jgi:hypothetical protein